MVLLRSIKLIALLLLLAVTATCSENYNSRQADILKAEFIRTYQRTLLTLPTGTNQSYSIDELHHLNSAALVSIAYRWHSYARDICSNNDTPDTSTKQSSYDKLTTKNNFSDVNFTETPESLQNCHSLAFLDNWSEIQKMISLNLMP